MITEIEVEDVGIMRHCNDWQVNRIRRMADRQNRAIAWAAFGLGMTLHQFKKLTLDQQRAASFPVGTSCHGSRRRAGSPTARRSGG